MAMKIYWISVLALLLVKFEFGVAIFQGLLHDLFNLSIPIVAIIGIVRIISKYSKRKKQAL
jgi:hypothetical protein